MDSNCVFELARMPFSRNGSYISVSSKSNDEQIFIHCVRRVFGEDKVFRMHFFDKEGEFVPTVKFLPESLSFSKGSAVLELYIRDENSLVAEGHDIAVKLDLCELPSKNGDVPEEYPLAYGQQVRDSHFKIVSVNARYVIGVHMFEGSGEFCGPYKLNERGETINQRCSLKLGGDFKDILFEVNIEPFEKHPSAFKYPDWNKDTENIRREWNDFYRFIPSVPEKYKDSALKSWYNLWSSTVPAGGNYKYPGVVMSKEFMSSIWTWDHCFNALALSFYDMDRALEQFFLPFELQAPNGALPDYINPYLEVVWGVTKPPIHGWCFGKLMEKADLSKDILEKAYFHLSRWTDWWLRYNDADNDGIPDYPMGCDSGWDNSTVFDLGYFIESPDLTAYLILQMDVLSRIALKIGREKDAENWQKESVRLYSLFNEHSWENGRYNAKVSGSHEYEPESTSLITLLPLVLGEKLEKDKRDALVKVLRRDFLTEYGLATEAYKGKYYKDDNYWRGAIWAPSTFLVFDGLYNAGEYDLAMEIAGKFCDMILSTAKGDYENFNALTGEGLRASGYTWTSSVNLLLLDVLKRHPEKS